MINFLAAGDNRVNGTPIGREGSRDYRMRCKRAPDYEWPGRAPYDGSLVSAVSVRPESRHGSHYAVLAGPSREGLPVPNASASTRWPPRGSLTRSPRVH